MTPIYILYRFAISFVENMPSPRKYLEFIGDNEGTKSLSRRYSWVECCEIRLDIAFQVTSGDGRRPGLKRRAVRRGHDVGVTQRPPPATPRMMMIMSMIKYVIRENC